MGHAANGLRETLIHERNFKIMLGGIFAIVGTMFYLPTSRAEKAILSTAIFAVLTLEMVNIVIERLLDFLHPAHHEEVRVIKDLMVRHRAHRQFRRRHHLPDDFLTVYFLKKEIYFSKNFKIYSQY